MTTARNREIDQVLEWKIDRFAHSTRHPLVAPEEFGHLGIRFISVPDQIDTDSLMEGAIFTIIGAMAELESSLISGRGSASITAADAGGRHLRRSSVPARIVSEIEVLAASSMRSIRQVQSEIAGKVGRGVVGKITKRIRAALAPAL